MARRHSVPLVHSWDTVVEEAVELGDDVNVDIQPAVHTKWQGGS